MSLSLQMAHVKVSSIFAHEIEINSELYERWLWAHRAREILMSDELFISRMDKLKKPHCAHLHDEKVSDVHLESKTHGWVQGKKESSSDGASEAFSACMWPRTWTVTLLVARGSSEAFSGCMWALIVLVFCRIFGSFVKGYGGVFACRAQSKFPAKKRGTNLNFTFI